MKPKQVSRSFTSNLEIIDNGDSFRILGDSFHILFLGTEVVPEEFLGFQIKFDSGRNIPDIDVGKELIRLPVWRGESYCVLVGEDALTVLKDGKTFLVSRLREPRVGVVCTGGADNETIAVRSFS